MLWNMAHSVADDFVIFSTSRNRYHCVPPLFLNTYWATINLWMHFMTAGQPEIVWRWSIARARNYNCYHCNASQPNMTKHAILIFTGSC